MAFPLSYFIFILPAVLGIILSLAVFIIKKKKNEKEKEKKNEKQSNETETVTELGRMLKELLNDYQKQARAAVDEEAGKLQEQTETVTELAKMMRETLADFQKQAGISKNNNQTVERLSEDMLEQEKPHRFSSQLLQNFTSNYSTKLVEGGYGAVYKGRFPNGRQLAVKVLINNPGIAQVQQPIMMIIKMKQTTL
ncbi:hypothetical protein COLO4_32281 [Corchorus olitorius]|uniref:Protein kinase domain-containing protein n=1 Tax=Corchorus olitorius TaxID=93759 RepID=A0A1R3GZW9_9ROSI|nr:hypothetical protein COLO4_32281 [Corchorus olitorius]